MFKYWSKYLYKIWYHLVQYLDYFCSLSLVPSILHCGGKSSPKGMWLLVIVHLWMMVLRTVLTTILQLNLLAWTFTHFLQCKFFFIPIIGSHVVVTRTDLCSYLTLSFALLREYNKVMRKYLAWLKWSNNLIGIHVDLSKSFWKFNQNKVHLWGFHN